jgi:hypothetical protein
MEKDVLYYDKTYGLGHNPTTYENILNKQHGILSSAWVINPMIVRVNFASNLPPLISLTDENGRTTTLNREGVVSDSELMVNDKDGYLLKSLVSPKSVILLHVANDYNDFEADIRKVNEALNFTESHLCGEITKKGSRCRNKTKHSSKKCHYHR